MNRRTKRNAAKQRRNILMVVALMVVVCVVSVGGTLAWLTDKTEPVTNTFSPTDINIQLEETMDSDGTVNEQPVTDWSADLVPGKAYWKNPKVTVEGGSEKCYLFVQVTEKGEPSQYLNYVYTFSKANGWTQLNGNTETEVPNAVWYRVVEESDTAQAWYLMSDSYGEDGLIEANVTVKDTLIKPVPTGTTAPDGFVGMPSGNLSIEFKAYAIQYSSFEPEIAEGETEAIADEAKQEAALKAWKAINPN